jgi:hypothetical protein
MENPAFTEAGLSNVRVTIVILCVLMEELPYQMVTRQILALEYLLSDVHGCLRLCSILLSIK